METKGNKTKQLIMEQAMMLFSEKGYSNVTMKDICESCSLSRGGLYGHFASTKEIFLKILTEDKIKYQDLLKQSFEEGVSATQMICFFFQQQKKEIQSQYNGFYFAIHEFSFVEKDQKDYINRRYYSAVTMLIKLLAYGQKMGEFNKFHSDTMAAHIVYLFDSMKTASATIDISDEQIDAQIQLVKEMVIKK